ncbi:MAG: TnsA endonuclease N-terminal domain-containing protein [Blautia hansenii]
MARGVSEKSRLKEERGRIDIEHPERYRPWIQTRDCSKGAGRRHIIPDSRHPGRMVHLMSDLERIVYIGLCKEKKVKEIFEQYPLDIDHTLKICRDYNIEHPKNPKTKQCITMTTDFVIFLENSEKKNSIMALAAKPACFLMKQRVREKLYIEKVYWAEKGIPWYVVTEEEVDELIL